MFNNWFLNLRGWWSNDGWIEGNYPFWRTKGSFGIGQITLCRVGHIYFWWSNFGSWFKSCSVNSWKMSKETQSYKNCHTCNPSNKFFIRLRWNNYNGLRFCNCKRNSWIIEEIIDRNEFSLQEGLIKWVRKCHYK